MRTLRYVLCDVFTSRALEGNQLAVFTDARGLSTEMMQRLASEMHLSETTFVLPAEQGGHAKVRIFTPNQELPFAGHPTLGSARAWVAASARMFHLPIGYVPELTRIPRAPRQDIDVLFYGSVNERRGQILAGLKAGGLVLKWLFGVYGAERDAFVARSKVVLNMHNFENKVFEIVRVSYLLANRKAVVSEISDTTAIEPDMMDAVAGVRYDGLVDCCRRLVGDIAARATLEETGFKRMAARNEIGFLRRLFADRAKAR